MGSEPVFVLRSGREIGWEHEAGSCVDGTEARLSMRRRVCKLHGSRARQSTARLGDDTPRTQTRVRKTSRVVSLGPPCRFGLVTTQAIAICWRPAWVRIYHHVWNGRCTTMWNVLPAARKGVQACWCTIARAVRQGPLQAGRSASCLGERLSIAGRAEARWGTGLRPRSWQRGCFWLGASSLATSQVAFVLERPGLPTCRPAALEGVTPAGQLQQAVIRAGAARFREKEG